MSSPTENSAKRARLLEKLKTQSVCWGDFVLSSGAKSRYYFDCKLTTLDPEGACLVGEEMLAMIQAEAQRLHKKIDAIGGLTMGADPIALAVGMTSWAKSPNEPLQVFTVRKSPKTHGKNKLIEGNFDAGMNVVVIDDVVTRGDATLAAVRAVEEGGAKVAFVAVFVDREEGGCDRIRSLGYNVVSLVKRTELIPEEVTDQPQTSEDHRAVPA
jgi:orotate phosphoribosyltransferase